MAKFKGFKAPQPGPVPTGKRAKIEQEAALEKERKRREAEMRALEEKESLQRDGMRWKPRR